MTRFTITDTAAGTTIATDLDQYDAAEALRAAFADAPAEVIDAAEQATQALETGTTPTEGLCTYLAIDVEAA